MRNIIKIQTKHISFLLLTIAMLGWWACKKKDDNPITINLKDFSFENKSFSMAEGETISVKVKLDPANAITNKASITAKSSDEKVATLTVTSFTDGVTSLEVKAIKEGTTTLSVALAGFTQTATATLTVTKKATTIPITKISLSKDTMTLGLDQIDTLRAVKTPSNTTEQIVWTASDTLATLNPQDTLLIITAKYNGTQTIYATSPSNKEIIDSTVLTIGEKTRTVTFDANGGVIGATKTLTVADGGTIPTTTTGLPTRTGYTLTSWNTQADGKGTAFVFGTTPVTANLTIYAQWTVIQYTVTLNANEGTDGTTKTITVAHGGTIPTTTTGLPTRIGYGITSWNTQADGKGTVFEFGTTTVTKDLTIYAQWGFTITFDSKGGSAVASKVVGDGEKTTPPSDPVYSPYTFKGWFKDAELKDTFDFAIETITANRTLFAKWHVVFTAATTNAMFANRLGHTSVVFKDKLWVIGGTDGNGNGNFKNDVWSSADGITWTQVPTSATIFTARANHTSVVFQDKIWVIGGDGANGSYNDVWYSSDGITWTQVPTSATIFTARGSHTTVEFKEKIWVIGGKNSGDTNYNNDAWSSSDGINWTEETSASASKYRGRTTHSSVVFKEKIWVIAGFTGSSFENDVWSSSDGKAWTKEITTNVFDIRTSCTSVVSDDKIWVIGGVNTGNGSKNDVWSSSDGKTWKQEKASTEFNARYEHSAVVTDDNKIWVIGGATDITNTKYLNDVWHTK